MFLQTEQTKLWTRCFLEVFLDKKCQYKNKNCKVRIYQMWSCNISVPNIASRLIVQAIVKLCINVCFRAMFCNPGPPWPTCFRWIPIATPDSSDQLERPTHLIQVWCGRETLKHAGQGSPRTRIEDHCFREMMLLKARSITHNWEWKSGY